jgi:DNA (cytosine-5)-methyltransferase 1
MSLAVTDGPDLVGRPSASTATWSVVDLFSGAGGMSCGFGRHPDFEIVGAADAEVGKPSSGPGTLGCNASFRRNIGVEPLSVDLGSVDPNELHDMLGLQSDPVVLSACAPCTGFSRTLARNHLVDDARNSLVVRIGAFAAALRPQVIVMENARELLMGRFSRHFEALREDLEDQGYSVASATHFLSDFGLPQRRERALIVAAHRGLSALGLSDLWDGLRIASDAVTVRRAIGDLPAVAAGESDAHDPMHVSPRFGSHLSHRRIAAIPRNGGSWFDLLGRDDADELLTPSMKRRAARLDFGSHPDVYGRLHWERPAATIKRECGHVGNGRYAHPEQDRLCTVRELALLQGFPSDYVFASTSVTNMYRHVGDAVPPLIAHQLAALVRWILTSERPGPEDLVMSGTSLRVEDILET